MKYVKSRKLKKALASFAGICGDTKGMALFSYLSLKHSPEDSTVYQMFLNAYSIHSHNWL